MLFLCYPKCSTCRKAQKWLDEHDVDYDIRDIKTDNPDLAELELWHQASGLPLKKFFNTSGQLYRSLELSKKLPGMSDAEQYALLASPTSCPSTNACSKSTPASPSARSSWGACPRPAVPPSAWAARSSRRTAGT